MRFLLLTFPTPVLVLLIVGGSIALSVALTYLVRRRVDEQTHQANNEVAGFIFAAVGVVYGVLLAFMVLVVWQEFEEAQSSIEHEANVAVNIYRLAQELPAPYASRLQVDIVEYTERVVNQEWATMQTGDASPDVDATIEKMWTEHRALHESNLPLSSHEGELFDSIQSLTDLRRIRLLESRLEIPTLMWILLIGGAAVTLGFTLFLRAPNWKAHLLMAAMFSGLVAFVLLLIVELDNPFTGDVHVPPTAFQLALQLFSKLK